MTPCQGRGRRFDPGRPLQKNRNMSPREIQRFDVGIKAFLVAGDKLLVVQDTNSHRWEIPGGRIDVGEEKLPTTEILRREIQEELGSDIQYTVAQPIDTWVVEMVGARQGDLAFLVGYECEYISGEIQLSDEHHAFQWVDTESWKKLDFIPTYPPVLERFWKRR